MKVGDLVKGWDGMIGVITHMRNHLGPGHTWVYVTVSWPDIGLNLEKSRDLEVVSG
tara:strand:- start:71 stop:238 length:168 start_codon:yes stop_codon:yes gene_type:complete